MSKLNDAPLVSVVTAAFNARAGVQATVESVASQGFRSVEHIVIDGGSTDGTREYLESLGDAVRWVSEPDGGIADALNKGIAMARGEYVLVLQAEDTFLDNQSLGRAAREFAGNADILSFDVAIPAENGMRIFRSKGFSWRINFFMTVPHQGAFCRRQLFEKFGDFDRQLRIGMDYDWVIRAKRAGATCKTVGTVLSVMPPTGISSRTHWREVSMRLEENRRIQARYRKGPGFQLAWMLFWRIYPAYKKWLAPTAGQGNS